MKKFLVQPSQNLSIVTDFLKFNNMDYQEIDLWKDNLIDFDQVAGTDFVAIIDFSIFVECITVNDSFAILLKFLENNKLIVWGNVDTALKSNWRKEYILELDAHAVSSQVTLVLDGQNDSFCPNNIQISTMPFNWFMKEIRRKTKETETNLYKKDFVLTMARADVHRDLLWEKLDTNGLLDHGFSVYHRTKNYNNWVGTKNNLHKWHDGHPSMNLYNNVNFEIVPETCYKDVLFITEKTIKPISCRLPFVVVSTPGYLEYLKSIGFETFGNLIDESYDKEIDLEQRVDMIVQQVSTIIKTGSKNLLDQSRSIRDHNYEVLAAIAGKWNDVTDEFLYTLLLN